MDNLAEKEKKEKKTKSGPTGFGLLLNYNDDLELAYQVITLYAMQQNLMGVSVSLKDRHIKILSYYMVHGFSPETMKEVSEMYNNHITYIRTMNTELMRYGCLVKDKYSPSKRQLSPVIVDLKNYFFKDIGIERKKLVFVFDKKKHE